MAKKITSLNKSQRKSSSKIGSRPSKAPSRSKAAVSKKNNNRELTRLKKIETAYLRSQAEAKQLRALCDNSSGFSNALLRAMPFAVDIVDQTGSILYMNEKLESLIGKDALGKKCWLEYKDDKRQCRYCPLRKGVEVGETSVVETNGAFGGKTFYITHTGMIYQDKKAVLEIFQDITERKKTEEMLRGLSVIDELSGLYNRRGFFALAGQQVSLAERRKISFSLIFIDIDNMKLINDKKGHIEGDRALTGMAKVLKHTCRDSDIIARMGGDEFVVMAVGAQASQTEVITRRLQRNIDNYNTVNGHGHKLSVSIGKSYYDSDRPAALKSLLDEADQDMYNNKSLKKAQPSGTSETD